MEYMNPILEDHIIPQPHNSNKWSAIMTSENDIIINLIIYLIVLLFYACIYS